MNELITHIDKLSLNGEEYRALETTQKSQILEQSYLLYMMALSICVPPVLFRKLEINGTNLKTIITCGDLDACTKYTGLMPRHLEESVKTFITQNLRELVMMTCKTGVRQASDEEGWREIKIVLNNRDYHECFEKMGLIVMNILERDDN